MLLFLSVPAYPDTPDMPKPKVQKQVDNPSLVRSVLRDKQTATLAAVQLAAGAVDWVSTVHWERQNPAGFEVGYPFHGHRPGVPAMIGETTVEVAAASLLAHEMHTSRFKLIRLLSLAPQSLCTASHVAGARRNYILY
jgi:hypothetical protein